MSAAAAARDAPMDELRALMAAHTPPLHALLVPSEDAHQSEYVSEQDKRRRFISGFNGSAGLALVTTKESLLWTDGRYMQETQQLSDRWKLMRIGEDPPVEVWIADLPSDTILDSVSTAQSDVYHNDGPDLVPFEMTRYDDYTAVVIDKHYGQTSG